jgi:transcription-repair coupling factor (superfamily II helicase)
MTTEVQNSRAIFSGVPEGFDGRVIADVTKAARSGDQPGIHLHVVRDDRRLDELQAAVAFFAPDIAVVPFPSWDTVPYDRTSPNPEIVARRITALGKLAVGGRKKPTLVLTTVNSILQRVPPRGFIRGAVKTIAPGQRLDPADLIKRLESYGYDRSSTVMEPGEYAQRGGILDLYPPGRSAPIRLDFFGDQLEAVKAFDAETQRSMKAVPKFSLMPVSEVAFGDAATALFRTRYVALFGGNTGDDPLYEAVSSGRRYVGQEHWLPFFHPSLETLFDYLPGVGISFDHNADDAIQQRFEQIREHYEARVDSLEGQRFGAPPYKPVPPEQMFLDGKDWKAALETRTVSRLTPFEDPTTTNVYRMHGKRGRTFAAERANPDANVFDAVAAHIRRIHGDNRRVILACWTPGARERLITLLEDHGLKDTVKVESFADVQAMRPNETAFAVFGIEEGFETPDFAVIAEQDILGDRLVRQRRRAKKAADVLTEATSLSVGDLVVHSDHGIGRFQGLQTITALGAPHDCLELQYAGGDKLFLPVENIELLSRYGSSDEGDAQLDRLGGVGWQTRKAKLKKRLREIANELIKVAAMRAMREAPVLIPPTGAYDEFVARFPYEETEDQAASIEAVLGDLASGKPMDRLVCGDVGFGKTEVALRAAFVAAMNGLQVALVVPTTLLSRQHYRTFTQRFQGLPVTIAQASRMVGAKELAEVKAGLKSGNVDIVIGTHALLGKSIEFARLGLLIIDEEQHFGVNHKERLKKMREDVHVLTLSATPIPRTLQLALTGVRELSLITTPPVDRLAVRTFISPFDPVILKEALRRERFRGGQTYYVAPRISDLDEMAEFLHEAVPDLAFARATGQMSPTELEDVMTAFYEGKYDILLSTAIVESGLDVPNANTLIVHRSDMFGLAQLYQLRGRVGRSKTRAYAYITTPPGQKLTEGAEKRLKVLQSLDTLGAGFSLASHDLDIRGAGNLLGEEQSGHIREVGFELYQSMLEEAVAAMKGGDLEADDKWSPEIQLGTSIMIPESYVTDLQLRLGLYRRLSSFEKRSEIDAFAAELVDRFGALPPEVEHLLDVMEIKGLCRAAGIAKVDAGPKGAVITLHKGRFANPEGLIAFVQNSRGLLKVQPDQRLVYRSDWDLPELRLKGVRGLVQQFADLAAKTKKAA